MKTITTTFILSKQGKPLGKVVWQYQKNDEGYYIEGSGSLSGDKQAADALNAAAEQAIREKWDNHFLLPPSDSLLDDPFCCGIDLLSLLIQAGFDMPPELERFYRPPEPEDDDDPLFPLEY